MRNCQIQPHQDTLLRTTWNKQLLQFDVYIGSACYYKLNRVNERDLSYVVKGPTFLSRTACRQLSETLLRNKTITGPKSRETVRYDALAPRPKVLR